MVSTIKDGQYEIANLRRFSKSSKWILLWNSLKIYGSNHDISKERNIMLHVYNPKSIRECIHQSYSYTAGIVSQYVSYPQQCQLSDATSHTP